MTEARTIAIDGPAASGKSAVGRTLAARLGVRFVDTGAMYRAATWLALHRRIDVHNEAALVALLDVAPIIVEESPSSAPEPTVVVIDGLDATPHLRDTDVEANVSLVSRVPGVRAALMRVQRALAADGDLVMAGRDIGTVVLASADLKIYLDASREVRARRRAEQLEASGGGPDVAMIMADLERRDGIDTAREASPLTAAPDAAIIHTDDLSIEEVVRRIEVLARG